MTGILPSEYIKDYEYFIVFYAFCLFYFPVLDNRPYSNSKHSSSSRTFTLNKDFYLKYVLFSLQRKLTIVRQKKKKNCQLLKDYSQHV